MNENNINDVLLEHFTEMLTLLKPCQRYTAEQIYGPELWKELPIGERLRIGAELSKLVNQKRLPLRYVGKVHGNTKVYKKT